MQAPTGRGVGINPANRFERLAVDLDAPETKVATRYLRDTSRTIISYNQSPDIPFEASLNPYRGCEHGCAYCYARPTHEYLGFSSGLDFETMILVKPQAADLLATELAAPSWKPQVLALSGVTDPYQPVERELGITRECLEVLAEYRNPVGIVTKNELVTRDTDLLARLAAHRAAAVFVSITTLKPELARALEPRAAAPARRLATITKLAAAGIPSGVMIAPVIPGLTEHEIPAILAAAAESGASRAGYIMLRLPGPVAGIFADWVRREHPDRSDKVLNRIRELRGGRDNDPGFGSRMRGNGPYAEQVSDLFVRSARRVGIAGERRELNVGAFRRPGQQPLPW